MASTPSWTGQFLTPVEANPYGGELSKSSKFLATTSALGVQIWDVTTGKSVNFYKVENQRIDAPTDAWWLDDTRVLIQVPGAQEILKISNEGKIIGNEKHTRVPGTLVKDIFKNGDWLVEVMDEDGSRIKQLWPNGSPDSSQTWVESETKKIISHKGDIVYYQDWTLTLPEGKNVLETFIITEGKIAALTTDYYIYEWNLSVLENTLYKLGF